MSATDELIAANEKYQESFAGPLPLPLHDRWQLWLVWMHGSIPPRCSGLLKVTLM